ncbi:MAG: PAS domain S-box protein [Ignavibacteriales bacterium]
MKKQTNAQLEETIRVLQKRIAELEKYESDCGILKNALKESEKRHRIGLENATVGIAYICIDGTWQMINQSFCATTGYTQDDLSREAFDVVIRRGTSGADSEIIDALLRGETIHNGLETEFFRKDGKKIWISVGVAVIKDAAGNPEYKMFFIKDISRRKEREMELYHSNERFRILFEQASEGIFITDLQGKLLDANKNGCRMLQYTKEELKKLNVAALIHAEDIEKDPLAYDALKKGMEVVKQRRAIRKDGTLVNVEISSKMLSDNRFLGIVRDITERKQIEEKLRESEEQYRRLVELSTNTVFIQSGGKIVFINQAGLKLFRAKNMGQLIGKRALDLVHPDSRPVVMERINTLIAQNKAAETLEDRYVRLDGSVVDVEVSAVPFIYKGKPAVQVIAVDITERKEAEEELNSYKNHLENLVTIRTEKLKKLNDKLKKEVRNHEMAKQETQNQLTFLKTLIETVPNPIYIKSAEKRYLYCNRALLELYGFTNEEAVGSTVFEVTSPDYAHRIDNSDNEVLRSLGEHKEEVEIFDSHNRKRSVLIHKAVVLKNDGTAGGIVGVMTDITNQRNLQRKVEEALIHEKELNELRSRFVSMASHEFRTPLTSIKLYSDLLYNYDQVLDQSKHKSYLEKIQKTVNYMTELVDDVLTISRVDTGRLEFNPGDMNLYQFCLDALNELEMNFNGRKIEFNYETELSNFFLDKKLLRLILTNLLSNALKYSPADSKVILSVLFNNAEVTFKIKDNGIGIPENDQKHMFEYFHRGENTGGTQGTGLGLTIVKRSVELHGGKITFESQENKGTTFHFSIPISLI